MNSYEHLKAEFVDIVKENADKPKTIGAVLKLVRLKERVKNLQSSKGCVSQYPWNSLLGEIDNEMKRGSPRLHKSKPAPLTVPDLSTIVQ